MRSLLRVLRKRWDVIPAGMVERGERKRTAAEVSLLFPYVLALWLAVSVAYVLWRLWRGSPFSWVSLIAIGLFVAILVAGVLPYEFWLNLSVDRLANSPHAGEFFVRAAGDGDLVTIKKFLARGISVDIRYRYNGKTGLHAAAGAGEIEVIKSLIAAGGGRKRD